MSVHELPAGREPAPDFGFKGMELPELQRLWRERSLSTESVQAARRDYVRLTALRAEIFSRLEAPASVKRWGKDGSK